MAFNPDAYLANRAKTKGATSFDPDVYLANRASQQQASLHQTNDYSRDDLIWAQDNPNTARSDQIFDAFKQKYDAEDQIKAKQNTLNNAVNAINAGAGFLNLAPKQEQSQKQEVSQTGGGSAWGVDDPGLKDDLLAAGRGFASGSTAGVSEPLTVGLSTLVGKAVDWDKPISDIYNSMLEINQDEAARMKRNSPIASAMGEMAGFVNPHGALAKTFNAVGKATNIPKIIEAAAPGLGPSAVPTLAHVISPVLRGGISNAAFEGVQDASKKLLGEDTESTPMRDFAVGGAFDLAGTGIGKIAKEVNKFIKSGEAKEVLKDLPGIKKIYKVKNARERAAFDQELADFKQLELSRKARHKSEIAELMADFNAQENSRKAAYELEKKASVDNFKDLINKDPISSAEGLFGKIKTANKELGVAYDDLSSPVFDKYANQTMRPSTEPVDKLLRDFGVMDDAGQVIENFSDNIISPERRDLVNRLLKTKQALSRDVDPKTYNRLIGEIADVANFNKGLGYQNRTERIFSQLSKEAKGDLEKNLSEIVDPESLQSLQKAKQLYATKKPLINDVLKTQKLPPERLAVNLRSKIPGSKIAELMQQFPETKDDLGELFLNMLTQHSVSPRKFTKEIDYFGRDLLKNLFGQDRYGALEAAESRLHEAAKPFLKSTRPTPIPFKPGNAPVFKKDIPQPIESSLIKWFLDNMLINPALPETLGRTVPQMGGALGYE